MAKNVEEFYSLLNKDVQSYLKGHKRKLYCLDYDLSNTLYLIEKEESYFNIERHTQQYKVYLSYGYSNKAGGDDSASISFRTKSEVSRSDLYLQKLLPTIWNIIVRDTGYCSGSWMLEGLWDELGADKNEVKQQLEEQCAEITREKIAFAKANYVEEDHYQSFATLLNDSYIGDRKGIFNSIQQQRIKNKRDREIREHQEMWSKENWIYDVEE